MAKSTERIAVESTEELDGKRKNWQHYGNFLEITSLGCWADILTLTHACSDAGAPAYNVCKWAPNDVCAAICLSISVPQLLVFTRTCRHTHWLTQAHTDPVTSVGAMMIEHKDRDELLFTCSNLVLQVFLLQKKHLFTLPTGVSSFFKRRRKALYYTRVRDRAISVNTLVLQDLTVSRCDHQRSVNSSFLKFRAQKLTQTKAGIILNASEKIHYVQSTIILHF